MLDCSNKSLNITPEGKFDITDSCKLFDFTVYSVLMGLLIILGLIGNVVSFIVLWKDSGNTATVFLLRSMAVADSLVLIAAVPLYVLSNIGPYTGYFTVYSNAYPNMLPYLWPSYLIPVTGTIMLTVLVSLNRYFCVCKPFSSAKICSKENAHRHVIYVALFAVAYNIPRFFEYHQVEACIAFNKSQVGFEISPFGKNKAYRIIYTNILYFIVMHGGPLTSLAFLNAKLIIALKKRAQRRAEMGKSTEGKGGYQQDVTLVLVVVICVFMCCQTPTFIDHLLWTFLDASQRHCGNWHYYYTAVSDLLGILNSSINFVIYTLTSSKFRRNLTASCTNSPEFERLPMTVVNDAIQHGNKVKNTNLTSPNNNITNVEHIIPSPSLSHKEPGKPENV